MTRLLQDIFSIKNEKIHKVYTILGIKIRLRNKVQKLKYLYEQLKQSLEVERRMSKSTTKTLFDLCQDANIRKNIVSPFAPEKLLSKITQSPSYLGVDSTHNFLNILLNCDEFIYKEKNFNSDKILICWEIKPEAFNLSILQKGVRENKSVLYIGDSFLRGINPYINYKGNPRYQKGISFTLDDLTSYFDATRMSRLEQMLNDKNLVITEEQLQRARKCINFIVDNHLTKYNHQPIFTPQIGRKGVEKVLVVDQSYGDMSIEKGLGNNETFENMLKCAIKENPDADIIVKTHPDTMTGNKGGYYTGLKQHDNIYTQTEPINPISLIKYVDKVYVCSTQFGFEALMCGKEVHVFGMPFYAGWGLTKDRQTCERRTNTRSLEEIFYIAYIMYSYYVNPDKKCRCEIEEAMDYLLNLREEYFNGKKD